MLGDLAEPSVIDLRLEVAVTALGKLKYNRDFRLQPFAGSELLWKTWKMKSKVDSLSAFILVGGGTSILLMEAGK